MVELNLKQEQIKYKVYDCRESEELGVVFSELWMLILLLPGEMIPVSSNRIYHYRISPSHGKVMSCFTTDSLSVSQQR